MPYIAGEAAGGDEDFGRPVGDCLPSLAIALATTVEGYDMAQYKYAEYLNQSNSEAYDTTYKPGENCLNSGIYRCEACGDEIASNKGNPFPPQNHHQHAANQGAIRWKLVVFAQQK